MAAKQILVRVLKNNGETSEFTMNETDYDFKQVQADLKDPTVDTVFVGRNSYKKHSIQTIEVVDA